MFASPSVYHKRPLTGGMTFEDWVSTWWSDIEIEAYLESNHAEYERYLRSGDTSSAEFLRERLRIVTGVQAHRLAARERLTDDPLTPGWTDDKQRRYESFRGLVDALRKAWPLERFMAELMLVELAPTGNGRLKGRCPFHDDRNPSMTVSPDYGTFRCWACGATGDIFDAVGEHFGLGSFRAQVEKLAEATPNLPQNDSPRSQTPRVREGRNNSRRRSGVRLVGGKVVAA